jgi:hypothetical protein
MLSSVEACVPEAADDQSRPLLEPAELPPGEAMQVGEALVRNSRPVGSANPEPGVWGCFTRCRMIDAVQGQ